MKNIKKRYWAIVVYPESLPPNWLEILQNTGLECAISPLHDKDINADNTPKKPHYHVILCYNNPTTYKNVKENICDILHCPIPQPLESVKGYYRYLVHKDNPDKYQYNESEILNINGFDSSNYFDLSFNELSSVLSLITDFIEDNGISEYRDLIVLLKDNDTLREYLPIAMKQTLFLNAYIKSYKYKFTKKS